MKGNDVMTATNHPGANLEALLARVEKLEKQIACCPHVEDVAMRERADEIKRTLHLAAEAAKPPARAPRPCVRMFLVGGDSPMAEFGERDEIGRRLATRLQLQLEKGGFVDYLAVDFEALCEADETFAEMVEMNQIKTRPCTPEECAALESGLVVNDKIGASYVSSAGVWGGTR